MSTISVRLPDSLHKAAREEAKRDNVSINQLIASALGEKISALKTVEYLTQRAKRAPTKRQFEKIMSKVPEKLPDKMDRF
jgi:hypothetical protein